MTDHPEYTGITNDDVWVPIQTYFDTENKLDRVQTDSYNDLITNILRSIVENYRYETVPIYDELKRKKTDTKDIKYITQFHDFIIMRPTFKEDDGTIIYPSPEECMERCIAYEAGMYADVIISKVLMTKDEETNEIIETVEDEQQHTKIFLGNMPTMVGGENSIYNEVNSNKYTIGGYFIINGVKKVIVAQERSSFNSMFTFEKKKTAPKYELYVEIRSASQANSGSSATHSTSTYIGFISVGPSLSNFKKNEKKKIITAVIPYISEANAIPIGILFSALGAKDDIDIAKSIFGKKYKDKKYEKYLNLLIPSLEESRICRTRSESYIYIGKKGKKYDNLHILKTETEPDEKLGKKETISYAKHLLKVELLPHLGTSLVKKKYFIGLMVKKLLIDYYSKYNNSIKITDRDHYANKRLMTAGSLLGTQFYNAFTRMCNEAKMQGEKSLGKGTIPSLISLLKPSIISISLRAALTQSKWSRGGSSKSGITQNLESFNYPALISNVRKIATPLAQDGGKVIEPRHLHGSHFGYVDCSDTPEGKKAGLNKYYALSSFPSIGCDTYPLLEILKTFNIYYFKHFEKDISYYEYPKIFLNRDLIGTTKYPLQIYNKLKTLRRCGNLLYEISIVWDEVYQEIRIWCDSGRFLRPLFIVEDGNLLIQKSHIDDIAKGDLIWRDLVRQGIVEYIDADEMEYCLIAESPSDVLESTKRMKFTHCELHPCLMFGVSVSIIPFPDKIQAPRVAFQANMGKQAIAAQELSIYKTCAGVHYILDCPQRPIVMSRAARLFFYDELPCGQNVTLMIACYRGYGQEDSIVLNQDSVDRGLFSMTHCLGLYAYVRAHKNEKFAIPDEKLCNKFKGNTRFLGEDGIIKKRTEYKDIFTGETKLRTTRVEAGDIIIGMVVELKEEEKGIYRKPFTDISIIYEEKTPGYVHDIQHGINGDGYQYVRVMIYQDMPPIVGDKLAQRNAQKGTIGILERAINLPFTRSGITPDLIFNPLGMPSRMTMNLFFEAIIGKKIASSSILCKMTFDEFIKLKKRRKYKSKENVPREYELNLGYDDISKGTMGDGTPFTDYDYEKVFEELRTMGLNPSGEDVAMDGMTGEELDCLIFNGPIFYQRLKHLAMKKIYSCGVSRKNLQTHQPGDGRKNAGGFKVGVMEKDCLGGYGVSGVLKDRLHEQSDPYSMYVCGICGLQAIVDVSGTRRECSVCQQSHSINKVSLPYGAKLLVNELCGMGVITRIGTSAFGAVIDIVDKVKLGKITP